MRRRIAHYRHVDGRLLPAIYLGLDGDGLPAWQIPDDDCEPVDEALAVVPVLISTSGPEHWVVDDGRDRWLGPATRAPRSSRRQSSADPGPLPLVVADDGNGDR